MFGYQQAGNRNQVYFDADSGRYYTLGGSPLMGIGFGVQRQRNYLDQSPFSNTNQSQIQQMLANRQPYQYNAPTAAQMFGGMQATPFSGMFGGMPSLNMGGMPAMGQGQGLFGAGRFLNGGLLSTSTTGT